jgi:hypothetical protein
MTKTVLICGSIAFDKIMQYQGRFGETLLADQLHRVNVSFLVPTLRTEFGGCSVNIAYNLNMLGGDPLIMGTIGQDGGDYLERMEKQGLATNAIRTIPTPTPPSASSPPTWTTTRSTPSTRARCSSRTRTAWPTTCRCASRSSRRTAATA